jgi:hypothetical protein
MASHLSQWSARAANAFLAARLKAMQACMQHIVMNGQPQNW